MEENTGSKLSRILKVLTEDDVFLFITRIARMFGYAFLSVVLILYLEQVGLNQVQIGLLLTLTLMGDTIISLLITTKVDRIGRRRMLIAGVVAPDERSAAAGINGFKNCFKIVS